MCRNQIFPFVNKFFLIADKTIDIFLIVNLVLLYPRVSAYHKFNYFIQKKKKNQFLNNFSKIQLLLEFYSHFCLTDLIKQFALYSLKKSFNVIFFYICDIEKFKY